MDGPNSKCHVHVPSTLSVRAFLRDGRYKRITQVGKAGGWLYSVYVWYWGKMLERIGCAFAQIFSSVPVSLILPIFLLLPSPIIFAPQTSGRRGIENWG